jgi:hypothetical protein
MNKQDDYVGIDNDSFGGMTSVGKMIRDAWVFEILPETETCQGWNQQRLDGLLNQVNAEWDKYGCMVSNLPEELFKRHQRIFNEAIARAKEAGWNGEVEIASES